MRDEQLDGEHADCLDLYLIILLGNHCILPGECVLQTHLWRRRSVGCYTNPQGYQTMPSWQMPCNQMSHRYIRTGIADCMSIPLARRFKARGGRQAAGGQAHRCAASAGEDCDLTRWSS